MVGDDTADPAPAVLDAGTRLYDGNGREVGVVRDVVGGRVEVDFHGDLEPISLRRVPGERLGEGYLLWRCSECGEMGDIESMPDRCPNCGTAGENLYAHLED